MNQTEHRHISVLRAIHSCIPALIVFLVAAGVGFVVFEFHAPVAENERAVNDRNNFNISKESVDALYVVWESRIDLVGAIEAREELKRMYQEYGPRHTVMHVYGALLFKKIGISGVGYCDESFEYGCYHQFFASVMRDEALPVADVDGACAPLSSTGHRGCYHGVGHGFVGSLGYDESSLRMALAYCDELLGDDTKSCYRGAFMEYYLRFLAHGERMVPDDYRPLNGSPFDICPSTEERYRRACYLELQGWWMKVYGGDFRKFGKLCGEIADTEEQGWCFAGVAKVAAWAEPRNIPLIIKRCAMMPEGFVGTCRRNAAMTVYERTGENTLANQLCENLPENVVESCKHRPEAREDNLI